MKLGLAFALVALGLILPNAYATTTTIDVNDNTYEITYETTGLDVEGLEADTNSESPSLIVYVSVTDAVSGTLDLTFDRAFFDSTSENGDDDFLVIADGEDVATIQSATETQRMLQITVPSGTLSLDIIGTAFGTGEPTPAETPSEETPVKETPAEESTEQTPVEETPAIQCGLGTVLQDGQCVLETTPESVEEPMVPAPETPQETPEQTPQASQCGPGTILQDGECVLDQTCGPGTILQDGQCVLDTVAPAPAVSKSQGTQLAIGIVAAFVISFIVMIILWAIGKAGRRKN